MRFFLNKKGDMSISTLVTLVIALVVLVIIVMIVWNYATKSGNSLQSTSNGVQKDTGISNGYCAVVGIRKCCDASDSTWKTINDNTGYVDCKPTQKCCINSGVS